LVGLFWGTAVEGIGGVGRGVQVDEVLAGTVAVVVVDGDVGTVDGKLFEVGTAVTVELSVEV
jgi:hypothetical protein